MRSFLALFFLFTASVLFASPRQSYATTPYGEPEFWREGARIVLVHDDGTCLSRCRNCLENYSLTCHAKERPRRHYVTEDVWEICFINGKVAFKAIDTHHYMERATKPYSDGNHPICFNKDRSDRAMWNYKFDSGKLMLTCDDGYMLARCPTCNWGHGHEHVYDAVVKSVTGNCNRFDVLPYNEDGYHGEDENYDGPSRGSQDWNEAEEDGPSANEDGEEMQPTEDDSEQ